MIFLGLTLSPSKGGAAGPLPSCFGKPSLGAGS